jgi:hypothetical protein
MVPWHTLGSIGNCQRRLFVKNIKATLLVLFVGLAVVAQGQAEDYYIYHDPDGKLVISNKEPPPGSKIIKQLNLPEDPQAEEPGKTQSNGQTENSPKPSKAK